MKSEIEVPDGWEIQKLGKLIESWGDGGTPSRAKSEYFGGKIPWVVIDDISYYIYETKEYLTDKGLKNSSAKLWKKGSVLLSIGASIGNVGIAMKDMCTKQGIIGIEPKDCINNEFLARFFEHNIKILNRLSQGSTIKEVRIPILKNIRVLLPPLNEQKKIADILSKVDEQISLTENIIAKTKELKKGLMQKLLTKGIGHTKFKETELGEIPEEWEIKRLDEIVDPAKPITYGIVQAGPNVENGIPYIRSGDLNEMNINLNVLLKTSFKIAEKYKRSEVGPGDIVFSLRGNVGTTKIVPNELKRANLTQGTARISCNYNMDNKYVNFILNSNVIKKRINAVTKGCTFREITLKELRRIKIPIPKINEQKQIASILSKVDEQIQDNKKELKHLQELKKGLMQDLLTGKVRVSV